MRDRSPVIFAYPNCCDNPSTLCYWNRKEVKVSVDPWARRYSLLAFVRPMKCKFSLDVCISYSFQILRFVPYLQKYSMNVLPLNVVSIHPRIAYQFNRP